MLTNSHHHHKSSAQSALLKLSNILPPSSTNLQINQFEPILYLRGNAEESAGCFLRGDLILNLSKPTKIRKIEMKFVGKMKTLWPDGRLYYGSSNRNEMCEKQEILTHNWSFISPQTHETPNETSSNSGSRFKMLRASSHPSQLIPAGVHKYPFELFIPGNVPETIDSKRGTVHYKLSAVAVRSGLSTNLHASQNVTIIRSALEERNSEGSAVAGETDQLGYEITVPKKAYPMGDSVDVDVRLSPRTKNMKVVGVKIQIKEESAYEAKDQKSGESRTLSVHKINDFGEQRMISDKRNTFQDGNSSEDESLYYHKNISIPIPKCTSAINHSYKSSSINISHHLKFIFTLNSKSGDKKKNTKDENEIILTLPITILSCRCAVDLPHYEDVNYNYRDDSPSYESPPSYEQSTNNESRQQNLITNNEIRHNAIIIQR